MSQAHGEAYGQSVDEFVESLIALSNAKTEEHREILDETFEIENAETEGENI